MIDATFCINLDRRPDRLQAFEDRYPWLGSMLPAPIRFAAIDGRRASVPQGWESGPGAWGCLRSHLVLWSHAAAYRQNLAIFEDDALFCDGFNEKLAAFLAAVPDDWHMLYLGGQHILPPAEVCPGVVRCRGVKKTHAYLIRGAWIGQLSQVILAQPRHIDVTLSMIHANLNVYAPSPWLVGQAASVSDVLSGSAGEPERWFDGRAA